MAKDSFCPPRGIDEVDAVVQEPEGGGLVRVEEIVCHCRQRDDCASGAKDGEQSGRASTGCGGLIMQNVALTSNSAFLCWFGAASCAEWSFAG